MAEQMTEQDLLNQEKRNVGTAWTRNENFDEFGFLVLKNLWRAEELYRPVPSIRGQVNYWGKKLDEYNLIENEMQVEGSLATYTHPQYKEIHLTRHADRDACEISVSVHISSNIDECWPFKIKSVQGKEHSLCLRPGDGLLYKGCERPHWRDPLQSRYKRKRDRLKNWITRKQDDTYYHQIFFHYVLADGQRAHCYNDAAR